LLGDGEGVTLIGDAGLGDRYARALAAQRVASQRLDGDACVLAGLGFTGIIDL
ncbi:MAG: 2-dehydro-3-deoxygalactonokinase, partial [Sphingobium sp.]|nr:2-dehydro-3-deoxygalactonokinase [Sphingobium sp.]